MGGAGEMGGGRGGRGEGVGVEVWREGGKVGGGAQ